MKFNDEYTKKYNDILDKDISKLLEKYNKEPYCNDTWYLKYRLQKENINWIPLRSGCSCSDFLTIIQYLEDKHPNLYFKCDQTTTFTTSIIGYRTLYLGVKK